jgi:DNA-binding GntR family transcriptional regulator
VPVSTDDPRPPYEQVADELRTAIRNGDYKPGDRLPTVRDLAEANGIARMTVQHAYQALRKEGLVVGQQGRGVYVRTPPAAEAEADGADFEMPTTLAEAREMIAKARAEIDRLRERPLSPPDLGYDPGPDTGMGPDSGIDI